MIVDLNECRRFKQELQDDYDRLVRWRASLEEAVPVANRHLDEIDKMLSEHPLLEPNMEMAIKSRAIYVLWLEYSEADALRKREILLSLHKIYRALPEHYQIEFCELWWRWLDDFEEEEIANGTRADSSRKYVWTPAARQLLRS
jgi:hypothetical protein